MKLIRGFKNFLYKCDFFYSTELLRYKTEPEYRTLFGGILSLLIIIGLIVTFYNKLIDTVNKVVITSVSSNLNAADPPAFTISTFPEDNFMFGVEIWHHDLNTGPRYFDMILTSVQLDTGERRESSLQYSLEPCTLNHWEGFPEVQKDFDRLKMNYWLCLPKNMKYNIQGKYASVFSQTLEVSVRKCTNESDPLRPCADQTEIDAYFLQQESFFFTIYFINPLINPTSEQYLTHYLEDNNYIIFTKDLGAEGVLFMEEYKITTDESILPFAHTHEDSGGIVTEFALKNPYQVTGDVYCSFAFFKSGISRSYERQFQKLDQILSYIGGLFGTIAIVLFLVNAYNGHSFEITLGAYLFHKKDEKEGNTLKNYNFINFILQGFYSLMNNIGCAPKWKTIREYYSCREEMVKQLDILYLLKRVFFLERIMNILFEEHQLKGLHLQQKMTLEQAKRIRKNFKLKRQILKKTESLRKKNHQEENTMNLTQQSISFPANKIFNNDQINLSPNKNTSNLKESNNTIGANDLNIFVDKSQEKDSKQLSSIHIVSEDSDSTESQNEEDLSSEVKKLKAEAERGDPLSKKIWKKIDKSMVNELVYLIPKQRTSSISQSDISEENSDQSQTKILKVREFSDKNLSPNVSNLHFSSSNKIKKDKTLKPKFSTQESVYQSWKNNYQQPENVLLEDQLDHEVKHSS